MTSVKRIGSGCKCIDNILGGGFEVGTLTQIFGEPGSGKTNMCLQLAVECVRSGKKVIFIDTEGFSVERFRQIAGKDADKISRSIIINEPENFDAQFAAIKEIETLIKENVALVLLDSASFYYRYELGGENEIELKRDLARQMASLLIIARKHEVAVVITNQIYTDIDHDAIRPLGGSMIEHISKAIVQLDKVADGRRRATLRKHRSMPEGASCEFLITGDGVKDIQG